MRQSHRIRRPISLKSKIYPEGVDVYAAAMSAEVSAHYPGRSAPVSTKRLPASRDVGKQRQKSAEGIVGRFDPAEGPNMRMIMGT